VNARTAVPLVLINALVSAALVALAYLSAPPRGPSLAALDVAELYRLKELQVAAVLVKRDASDEERTGALRGASAFGTDVSALLQKLPDECGCVVLARGAVVGAAPLLRDLTPDVRRRLGL
jgi:hypothetical protein